MKQLFLLISLLSFLLSSEEIDAVNVITGEYCETQTDFISDSMKISRSFSGIDHPSWEFNLSLNKFKSGARKLSLDLPDGQSLTYQLLSRDKDALLIEKVFLSDNLIFEYRYISHPLNDYKLIHRRDEPNGYFLITDYYDAEDEQDSLRDWRIGKVKTQKAPVGTDATPITTHSFFYYIGRTEVYDAYQNKTVYYHSQDNLTSIEHYLKDLNGISKLYRIERFFWRKNDKDLETNNLVSKTLEDATGTVLSCQTSEYNEDGQVIKETLYGNLSGQCQVPIILQENGFPIDNGIESYSIHREFSNNLLVSQSADNGSRTLYHYDPQTKNLSAELLCDGEKVFLKRYYQYDAENHLVSIVEDDGVAKRPITKQTPQEEPQYSLPQNDPSCIYDLAKRLIRKEESNSEGKKIATSYRYDYLGNLTATIDPLGNETLFEYDDLGRLTKTIAPSVPDELGNLINPTTRYEYDAFDRLTKTIDPRGYQTCVKYNLRGKPIEILYPDGTNEFFEYNLDGSLKKAQTKTGQSIIYTRDGWDRVTLTEVYDAGGQLQWRNEALYHALDLISSVDFEGTETHYTYDQAGKQICIEQKARDGCRKTELSHDSDEKIAGSVSKNSDNFIKSYEEECVNSYGQTVLKRIAIDSQGNMAIFIHDVLGRCEKIEKKNSLGMTVWEQEIRYDASGNKTRQMTVILIEGQEKNVQIDAWSYGPNNRLESQIQSLGSPLQRQSYLFYNLFGQLETYIKPDSVSLYHLYHPTGQLSEYYSSDGTIHYRYFYDAKNNLIEVEDLVQNTLTKRTYNSFNELLSEKLSNGMQLSSSYDSLGRRTSMTLPDSSSIHYDYQSGYLKNIRRHNASEELLYHHDYLELDVNGHVISSRLIGNAGNLDLKYDDKHNCIAVNCSRWNEEIHYNDANHTIQTINIRDPKGALNKVFQYDDQKRLVQENDITSSSFAYDSLSNRIIDQGSENCIDALNQLVSNKECQFDYDCNGNRIIKKSPQETFDYRYDALDRLVEVKKDDTFLISFAYDAFHRRVSKTASTWNEDLLAWEVREKWDFLYDGDNEIGMSDSRGKFLELRILGIGRGAEIGAAIAHELHGKTYAPIHNHQGSVVCLLDANTGSPVEFYRYTAFGEEEIFSETGEKLSETAIHNFWRFSSKRTDSETDCVYYGKRYYDPSIGRWLTKDPMGGFDGPNPYAFLNNNPLSHYDLYGLFSWDDTWDYFFNKKKDYLKTFSKFVTKVNKIIHHDLSYISYIKKEIEGVAAHIFGKGFLQFSGYYGDNRPSTGCFGKEEINSKVRVTLINGILNVKNDFLENLRFFSETHGNTKIHYVFYPTEGWTRDMLSCLFVKMGFVSLQARMMAQTWKHLIEEMGGVEGGGTIIHYAHSIGATNTYVAKNLLSPAEQRMIRVITLGSPTIIPKSGSGFASVINYVSKRDGVCLLDPLGLLYGWLQQNSNVIFLGSVIGMPIVDHPLTTENYTEILKDLGKNFFENYGSYL